MFTFKEPKIVTAIPIDGIKSYLSELGALESGTDRTGAQVYGYAGLEIEIAVFKDEVLPNLGLEKHTVSVRGDKEKTEEFLNAFVYRFLSIGG